MPSSYHHQCRGTVIWARQRSIPQSLALLGIFVQFQIRLPANVLALICDFIPEMFVLCRHVYARCSVCQRFRCNRCGASYLRGDTIAIIPPACMCIMRRSRRLSHAMSSSLRLLGPNHIIHCEAFAPRGELIWAFTRVYSGACTDYGLCTLTFYVSCVLFYRARLVWKPSVRLLCMFGFVSGFCY